MAEYANIIVDIFNEKLDKTFQYRIPEAMKEKLTLGMQVYVPFGKRNIKGYVAVSYTHLTLPTSLQV